MPPSRRYKSAKSSEKAEGVRKSPRKKKVPKAIEETSSGSEKTPKRIRRRVVKSVLENSFEFSDCKSPSTCSANKDDKICSFYRVTTENGKPVFSKSLIKYFMTVDSPEMAHLKSGKFNTSFLRETPKNRDSLKIFSDEEDKDPKWLMNVPKLNFDMPDIPGSQHSNIFESMPISGDSDEELKKLTSPRHKRRKSTRCTEFKGKPLPEQSLSVDYTGVLYSESSRDDDDQDDQKDEVVSENENSILLSLLKAPSDRPIRPYKYRNRQPSSSYNLSSTKEDELLLNKYKDIMGDKQANVVLTRLPIDAQLKAEKCSLSLKSTSFLQGKKKVSEVKENVHKKTRVPRVGSK